ncbi:MAG: hypothetical protein WC475_01300 [Candidatus Paceibacterota bacterium]
MTVIKTPIYIGIENEFQLMRGNRYLDFENYFKRLEKKYGKKHFNIYETAIRTVSGTSIYNDGNEPELCIPPVKIEKGAATNASDLLYLARKELVDFVNPSKDGNGLSLIGFTSHFSITNPLKLDESKADHQCDDCARIMDYAAVPYSLFCLNPTSTGIGLRPKFNRLELLGDFVPDIDQNRAFLNFYMGTMPLLWKNSHRLPFRAIEARRISENLVHDGRYSKIDIVNKNGSEKKIYAQDYLETYYNLFKESIKEFATESEMKNLEDFIYMKKPLEIDKFKKWAHGSIFKSGEILIYSRELVVDDSDYLEKKNLPDLTSKFLSRIVSTDSIKIEDMDWNEIKFEGISRNSYMCLNGIYNQGRLEKLMQNYEKTPEDATKIIQKYIKISNMFGTNDVDFIPESENALCEFAKIILEGKCPFSLISEDYDRLAKIGLFDNGKPTDFGRNFANAVLSSKHAEYDFSKNMDRLHKKTETKDRILEYDSAKDYSLPDFEEKMKKSLWAVYREHYEKIISKDIEKKLQNPVCAESYFKNSLQGMRELKIPSSIIEGLIKEARDVLLNEKGRKAFKKACKNENIKIKGGY